MNEFWNQHAYLLYIGFLGTLGIISITVGIIGYGLRSLIIDFKTSIRDLYNKYDCLEKDVSRLQGEHDVFHGDKRRK